MKTGNLAEIEHNLRQITDLLLLNGTLTECPGLLHGKLGIAVFFFHYSRYTDNLLFADYALDLIGEMQNKIHTNSSADYEKGIAGIGVGIDYLIRNDFLDTEDDIYEDLDQRMVRAVMYDPWQDFSLYDGLTGYGRYWISRLRHQPTLVQAQECLRCIAKQIEEKYPDISQEELIDVFSFFDDSQEFIDLDIPPELFVQCKSQLTKKEWNLQKKADKTLTQIPDFDKNNPPASMGLLFGLAGEGMLRLTALGSTDKTWIQLL